MIKYNIAKQMLKVLTTNYTANNKKSKEESAQQVE